MSGITPQTLHLHKVEWHLSNFCLHPSLSCVLRGGVEYMARLLVAAHPTRVAAPSSLKVNVQHFHESFISHVHPFLCRVEVIIPGASGQVLEDFLVQVAAEDLEPCLAVLQLLTDKVCERGGVIVSVGGCACECVCGRCAQCGKMYVVVSGSCARVSACVFKATRMHVWLRCCDA